MNTTDPQVVHRANSQAEQRLQLEVERNAENARYQAALSALTHEHEQKLREFTQREQQLNASIWQTVDENRDVLIAKGKRSFATMAAKFQLRDTPAKVEVLDKAAIMQVARRLRVIKKIAHPPKVEWRFNQKKFLEWLSRHPEQRTHFEEFLQDQKKGETLTVQPNTNYTVEHDSKRISPPSITIRKS